jgi:hypothetical protein
MLCYCCFVPLLLQSLGFISGYKIHILSFFFQICLLIINKVFIKKKYIIKSLYIAIILNICIALCHFLKNHTPYIPQLNIIIKILIILGILNMSILFYRNIKNFYSCDKNCKHK